MPKMKKDAKEFEVSINYVDKRGYSSSIPRPVIEILGSPETIKFIIQGDKKRNSEIRKTIIAAT